MKIDKDELLKWCDNDINKMNFNWFDMDTTTAKTMSDEDLLGRISLLPISKMPGFGFIAELCKRFNTDEFDPINL